MSYKDALSALHLEMPTTIPRTEYSTSIHYPLMSAVTGNHVDANSSPAEKDTAIRAFEKAWNFGLTWDVDIFANAFGDKRTKMGHAAYHADGSDYDNDITSYFKDEDDVFAFDPWEAFGELDIEKTRQFFNTRLAQKQSLHPEQVCTCGTYVTLMSGMIDLFGWDLLLTAIGVDPKATGKMANRYAAWFRQYLEALAKSDTEVFMVHDDIVWTSGAFADAQWYRDYIFRNYESLFDPLLQTKRKLLYTSDGDYTAFIDDIAACGVNGFVMEPTTDMAYIAKNYGQTHAFIGNADCRILMYGDKDAIHAEVKRCVDIGRDCPGFFMATGNHIPPNVPVENALRYQDAFATLSQRR